MSVNTYVDMGNHNSEAANNIYSIWKKISWRDHKFMFGKNKSDLTWVKFLEPAPVNGDSKGGKTLVNFNVQTQAHMALLCKWAARRSLLL